MLDFKKIVEEFVTSDTFIHVHPDFVSTLLMLNSIPFNIISFFMPLSCCSLFLQT